MPNIIRPKILVPHHNAPSACGRNLALSARVLKIKALVVDLRIILNAKGNLQETKSRANPSLRFNPGKLTILVLSTGYVNIPAQKG